METTKNIEMIKEFIEKHAGDLDKEKLTELGSGALMLLSGLAAGKVLRAILIGAVVAGTAKFIYDRLSKEPEAEAA